MPSAFKTALATWEARIYRCELLLAGIALTMLIIALSIVIFGRFINAHGIEWAPALANFLFLWLAWIGAGLASRAQTHLVIDILPRYLTSPKSKSLYAILYAAVTLFYSSYVIFYGVPYATMSYMRHYDVMPFLSKFFVYIAVPIGCFLMIAHTLINLYLGRIQTQHTVAPDA